MKFYFIENQLNIRLVNIKSCWLLVFIILFYNTISFAQSPIKPDDSTIESESSPNLVSITSSPIKPNTPSANPLPASAGMPNSATPSVNPLPPSAGMPNPANPSANPLPPSAGMPNSATPSANPLPPNSDIKSSGNANQMNIQTSSLGKISSESISNSISKILGDASESNIPTLMFNELELTNINRAIDSLKNNQIYVPEGLEKKEEKPKEEEEEKKVENEVEENEKSYIYLGSVIYFSANDWVIWLNDQKISTSTNNEQKEIYVSSVDKDCIKVRWKMSLSKWKILSGKKDETMAPRVDFNSNVVESEFELRPNQTFILGSNSVVEGKAVIALIKKKESKEKSSAKKADGTQDPNSSSSDSNPLSKGANILSTIKTIQQMNQQLDENKEQVR